MRDLLEHFSTQDLSLANVPEDEFGQAYEFYRGLRQVGVDTELVVYPRERHGFREISHQIDLVERIVEWFERYLKTG